MSKEILPATTAGIFPEQFSDGLVFAKSGRIAALVLAFFMLAGFAFRIGGLGTESLGEDELNKLQTVEEYRANGLSGKNGEHPFLMKGLQTASIIGAEKLNSYILPAGSPISVEAALRFPVALFGTFTALLIFLLVSELFGRSIGLVAAILWTIEPMAIGFDRIAKEDSLVLFFFLVSNLFWLRSQTAAERGKTNWIRYAWGAAAGFAALMASKYYPHLLAITGGYYSLFITVPGNKWNMGKAKWLKFFIVMGVIFLILNPTILLPDTWREMLKFSSEGRIGHDSYEYIGALYPQKMTLWLAGVPWTFYYVFIATKISIVTLILFLAGLPMMFMRRLGDGRFFIFFWAFMWFMPFTVLGGKFTRYFTLAEPLILIAAAVAFCFALRFISKHLREKRIIPAFQAIALGIVVLIPVVNSLAVYPHFRLFTNVIGGGMAGAGKYFPHDEFYDLSSREIISEISAMAPQGSIIACETPILLEYYAKRAGRDDLRFVSLSDKSGVAELRTGDFVVVARGRRYFSNAAYEDYLKEGARAAAETSILNIPTARIYCLNETTLAGIRLIAK